MNMSVSLSSVFYKADQLDDGVVVRLASPESTPQRLFGLTLEASRFGLLNMGDVRGFYFFLFLNL